MNYKRYLNYEIVLRRCVLLEEDDSRPVDEIINEDLNTNWFVESATRDMFGPDEVQNITMNYYKK